MRHFLAIVFAATYLAACAPDTSISKNTQLERSNASQELETLSRKKWGWMADRNIKALGSLFHDQSKFVHMSGTWGKAREMEIIENNFIWYKRATVHDVATEIFDNHAIVWNRITLDAVVRDLEVSNEFTTTEAYLRVGEEWKLTALTFSKVRDEHNLAD